MLGEIRPAPAILFYLLYVAGLLVFVSGPPARDVATATLLYGALFGLFCYATFELTSLSLLKHWTWRGGGRRRVLGSVCDRDVVHAGCSPIDRTGSSLAIDPMRFRAGACPGMTVSVRPYFGCGTIRMYGFGDFQPCG